MRVIPGPYGTFTAWDQDIIGNALAKGEFWDAQIRPFLDEAGPKGWALDLGANIGFFSVYLARIASRVIAVEAHPRTFQILLDNLTRNQVADRVWPLWGAAYDRVTTLRLVPGAWCGWTLPSELDLDQCPSSSSIAFFPESADPRLADKLAVPAFPLDPIIPPDRISLVKVDCQGCDLRAMMGIREVLRRDRPLVVFEVEHGLMKAHGDSWDGYRAFFAALDYTVTRVRPDLWDYVARPHP